jgi:hypothetical protein
MACIYLDKNFSVQISIWANEPNKPRKNRGTCNARTRKGTLCKAPPVWNKISDTSKNKRCKLHGGMSTGPRTQEGRNAIRASNRRRGIKQVKNQI